MQVTAKNGGSKVASQPQAWVNDLETILANGPDEPVQYHVTYGTFTADAAGAWPEVGPVLMAMEAPKSVSRPVPAALPIWVGPVSRMEFIWQRGLNRQGVVLYDAGGTPLVHVVNALLGYQGSGPTLSRLIMETFGVSDHDFYCINGAVANQDYIVVLDRSAGEWVISTFRL